MKFTAEYRVDTHQTDMNGRATVSAVLQYMQETAYLQHWAFGPTINELLADGKAFVLSRAAMDLRKPLFEQDRVTVSSWLNLARGYGYYRNSVLKRGEEVVAEMTAFWGVIGVESRRPLLAEEVKLGFGTDDDTVSVTMPLRFRPPKEVPLAKLGSHCVSYSDCDRNGHMNNTRYPALFCDFTDGITDRFVTGFAVNFQNEARYGTSFDVYGAREGNDSYFRTVLEDGAVGAEALITLEGR